MQRHAPIATPAGLGLALAAFLACVPAAAAPSAQEQYSPDDPTLRRCINWMVNGTRGFFLEELCLTDYGIPPPSLALCARKVQTGFTSANDREACALIFEEQARRVRAGYIKTPPPAVP